MMAANTASIVKNLLENLELVIDQVKDGESARDPNADFDKDIFWKKLDSTYKVLSNEATKLCMCYSEPPVPDEEECAALISGVEKAALAAVSTFYDLPISQGLTFRRLVRLSVLSVIQGVHTLVQRIESPGPIDGPQTQRQATGNVWECCDEIQALPRDNKSAVLKIMKDNEGLIKDALEELEEAQDNDGGFNDLNESLNIDTNTEDAWSQTDKSLLSPCLGLVKAAKACLKKVYTAVKNNGDTTTIACISQLDDLADLINPVSAAIDEFVSGLYPPMEYVAVKQKAETVVTILKSLLEYVKSAHFYTEADVQWIEFLLNATEHNMNKITQMTHTPSDH